jgi:hypothetical protein
MSQNLRDFIASREAAIKEQINALHDELRELRAAQSAIQSGSRAQPGYGKAERMTHRDMILAVLDANSQGGTADQVVDLVRERFSVDVPLGSMSSSLSRAKADQLVSLDQRTKVWRLRKHAKEDEPPKGGSVAGEVPASPDINPSAR